MNTLILILALTLYLSFVVKAKFLHKAKIRCLLFLLFLLASFVITKFNKKYSEELDALNKAGEQTLYGKSDNPKPCKYGDSVCITETIEHFLNERNQGDSSINFVKIEPLAVKKISIKQGADSPVNIDLTFTNSHIHGLSKAKVIKVKGFGKDMTQKHELTLRAEQLDLVSDYTIKGKVLILPITGNGKSNITMVNVDLIVKFNGTPLEKDGATYMKVDKFQLQPEPKKMITRFDNLFNGDKALSDNMNLFLNENWADIYKELKGSVASAFGKIFQSVIGHVFAKYPYDKYFEE